jgi:hypothetical protein
MGDGLAFTPKSVYAMRLLVGSMHLNYQIMNFLLKEQGTVDDENYIYLDKDGIAKKRGELTVHWEPVPSKRVLVTFKSK